ncbi:MAG: hypothetical protein OXQ29_07935 [Rhodospirillaceae bacterium]|nr:hypothetical protein [Rhodospirillaceae bacterium]
MKPILCVAYAALLALMFSPSHAQEARIEQIHIYENETGIIYLNETFHINQENSPVQIKKVTARHIPGKTAALAEAYYDGLFRYLKEHEKSRLRKLARETLTISIDAEGGEVVAVKFGIIVYDAFKEFLGGLTGITMNPPTVGMKWDYNPVYLFKFEKYGVVGVYVRQARLKDGRIWNFDENFITSEFSEKLGEITREQIVGSDS